MGKDTFMIAKQQATGFPGLGNMKAEIIAEGSRHCASLGKEFQLVSAQDTKPPYIFVNGGSLSCGTTRLTQWDQHETSFLHFAVYPRVVGLWLT